MHRHIFEINFQLTEHFRPELLSSTKVLVLEDPRGPIFKSLSSFSALKSLKIFEDSVFCNLHTVGY